MEEEVGAEESWTKSKEPLWGRRSTRRAVGSDVIFGSGGGCSDEEGKGARRLCAACLRRRRGEEGKSWW
jgi:hypothetical protein